MLLYYITDRKQFRGTDAQQCGRLLAKIAEAARCGIDFIQLREKDLSARELLGLTGEAARIVRDHGSKLETGKSKLLVNSRSDIALAGGADGVHLTSADIPASDARAIWARTNRHRESQGGAWIIGVSCHTPAEIRMAEAQGSDFAVFAPVFEKAVAQHPGVGLELLQEACRCEGRPAGPEGIGTTRMPVLALGGITVQNAAECIAAGAAGVAGIRLFQENDIAKVVAELRHAGQHAGSRG